MPCLEFWTGSAWTQATEVHVYNGTAWAQATDVYVWDGTTWARVFPCVLAGLTAAETANILDTAAATKIARTVIKTSTELLLTSETTGLTKKSISVAETANILDTAAATKVSRDIVKTSTELLSTSETGVISITVLDPVITSCIITGADNDEANFRARCRFSPGALCESVIVEYRLNSGSWTFLENTDTTPSVGPVISSYFGTESNCEQTIDFRIRPFTGDGQTGTEGTPCITNSIVLGGEGSCG